MAEQIIYGHSQLTDHDIYLFKQGKHFKLYEKMGAHYGEVDGKPGYHFSVWAPNAKSVSVIADFNSWDDTAHPLTWRLDQSGIWEGFIPGVEKGALYKYKIVSHNQDAVLEKGDPFACMWELAPNTASVVWDTWYEWSDDSWMENRHENNGLDKPMSTYEMHPGSWRRRAKGENRPLTYTELADELPRYLNEMGFTHVEFLPVMEHPFYGSWGYQCLGYFAPTSRYGSPQEFMHLVECLHNNGIGVILDWVPSHFPNDPHGLAAFDGTNLYEHADPRQGFHPDWKSAIFNFGRNEVRSFLISSAFFWMDVGSPGTELEFAL